MERFDRDRQQVSISCAQATSTALPEENAIALRAPTEPIALSLQQDSSELVSQALAQQQCVSVTSANDVRVDDDRNVAARSSEQQFEQLISNILKYGVFLSSAIVLVGGILYLIRHGAEPADYQFFQGEPSIFRSPGGVVTAVLSGHRRGIVQLGLLVLIATPIARVAFSFLAFLKQRDFTYVIVTLCVLVGLIYSLIGASS